MTPESAAVQSLIADVAQQVASRLDRVSTMLQRASDRLSTQIVDEGSDVISELESAAIGLLTVPDTAAVGAGYAGEIPSKGKSRPTMVWWVRSSDGGIAQRSHNVNPAADNFYNYVALKWYASAKSAGSKVVTGPFIDMWGSDDFTVTVSIPMRSRVGLDGVLAADVDVRRLLKDLSRVLRRTQLPLAVVNETERVVVSSVPTLSTGLLLTPRAQRDRATPLVIQRVRIPGYNWYVCLLKPQ